MTRKRTSENDLVAGAVPSTPSRRKSVSRTRTKHTPTTGETPTQSEAVAEVADIIASEITVSEPSRDQIAELAYLYWEARGCQGGSPEEDWLRAEHDLRLRSTAAATATA
jgi:Protein of unknown function (DUF2934)